MATTARGLLAGLLLAALSLVATAAVETNPAPTATTPVPNIANQRCLRCHADTEEKSVVARDGSAKNIYVDPKVLERSVHGDVSCVGCHRDITKLPHAKPLAKAI